MVWVEALIPFDKGELLSTLYHVGIVERTVSLSSCLYLYIVSANIFPNFSNHFCVTYQEYIENGTLVRAHVPLRFARLLTPMRQMCVSWLWSCFRDSSIYWFFQALSIWIMDWFDSCMDMKLCLSRVPEGNISYWSSFILLSKSGSCTMQSTSLCS